MSTPGISHLYDCIFGPKLYRFFDIPSREYQPSALEYYADKILTQLSTVRTIATYTSPFLFYIFFNREEITRPASILNNTGFKIFITMSFIYYSAKFLRGCSRSVNPHYKQFIQTYTYVTSSILNKHIKTEDNNNLIEAKRTLREKYDFEFSHWPIDFKWYNGKYANERPPKLLPVQQASEETLSENIFTRGISYLMAHSVGRIMLYPGSLKILQLILEQNLITGRRFLIENHNAKRYKLLARDNNAIDCMFVDKRGPDGIKGIDHSSKGRTLVICSEGNAGYYEIGIFNSPLNQGYSVLGWNHPGFGGSTGYPYPENDVNACDVVINFAVTELGFELNDIYLFAWSIGGFPTAWAASQYPEVKGVILDASFDDVLPLARSKMLPLLEPVVDITIRYYFNLNVSAYLNLYKGPILLIRRLSDEIIPINPNDPIRTNRGNFILMKLLKNRFPKLLEYPEVSQTVERFLHTDQPHLYVNRVNREECLTKLVSYIQTNQLKTYPIELSCEDINIEQAKNIIIYMSHQMFKNFNSTHCTPLPPTMFAEPFDLFGCSNKSL